MITRSAFAVGSKRVQGAVGANGGMPSHRGAGTDGGRGKKHLLHHLSLAVTLKKSSFFFPLGGHFAFKEGTVSLQL